jgi:hypothetical protein
MTTAPALSVAGTAWGRAQAQLAEALRRLSAIQAEVWRPVRDLGLEEIAELEVLGAGNDRLVVALESGLIAKLEADPEPLLRGAANGQNGAERAIWRRAGPLTRQLLCPVLAHGRAARGSWLVMPYCVPETVETFSFDADGEVDFESGPEAISWVAVTLTEDAVLAENQGWLEGRRVVLDYGRSRHLSSLPILERHLQELAGADRSAVVATPGRSLS